jgi:hypothetical protein
MTQNVTVSNPFSSIFSTINRTESNEPDTGSFNMSLNFSSFKKFALQYSREGARAA